MDSIVSKSLLLSWAEYGMEIDDFVETPELTKIYISVPESSEYLNKDGQQMAGEVLAKRIKEICDGVGARNYNLKYKVRHGERWTKQDGKVAILEKAILLGV